MSRFFLIPFIVFFGVFLSGCDMLKKQEKSGIQVLITNDVSASVYLEDAYIEKTPFIKQDLKPGSYTLKIQPDDPSLAPHELMITLRPGLLTVVAWKLAPRAELSGGVVYEMEPIASKDAAELSFSSIPDGTIITINENQKYFTPKIVGDITSPEAVSYEAYLPSYEPQNHTISPLPGYRTLIHIKLAKIDTAITPPPTQSQVSEPQENIGAVLGESIEASDSAAATVSAAPRETPIVLILPTGFFHSDTEVLRMRESPSSLGTELGFVHVGKEYVYLGKTENNWHNIKAGNTTGWVNGQYAELKK